MHMYSYVFLHMYIYVLIHIYVSIYMYIYIDFLYNMGPSCGTIILKNFNGQLATKFPIWNKYGAAF